MKLEYFASDNSKENENAINVDFDNLIYNNLKSQQIKSKFLGALDKSDFRNLGFELFYHQNKLQKAIKKLIEKYPVPADDDDNDQIEGLNVDPTAKDDEKNAVGDIDAKYICPITKELMKIPVIAYDGCVYEKEAIVKYMRQNHTTPKQSTTKLETKEKVEEMVAILFPHYKLQKELQALK